MQQELPTQSLLESEDAAAAAAPFLFLVDPVEGVNEMEVRGEFTAERLMDRRPEIYRAVVDALGQGMGIRQICRAYRVSHHTVAAVMAREPKAVATVKEGTIGKLRQFAMMAADRLLDEVHTMPVGSIPLAMGIAIDKAQLLDGGATSRIEHADAGPTHEDYLRMVQGKVIEAEILPATGLEGEKDSAIRALDGADEAAAAADRGSERPDVPAAKIDPSDAESDDFGDSSSVRANVACSPACCDNPKKEGIPPFHDHPGCPGRDALPSEGGGGGPVSIGACPAKTDPSAENF